MNLSPPDLPAEPDPSTAAGPSMHAQRTVGPATVVLFGASGDLTKRKLIPSFHNLARERLLPEAFAVIGVSREPLETSVFRQRLRADAAALTAGGVDPAAWAWIEGRLENVGGNFTEDGTYVRLAEAIARIDHERATQGNVLFYLAVGPDLFAPIVRQLAAAGLLRETGESWRRVIIEKPFGRDLSTARELNAALREHLHERQIYRIDHYLGKETVQNLLVFRFANGIFEPVWNRRYVDHVQITVAETLGVEKRGGYYERSGALRDMVPNHIFQLLSLTAMEPPISFDADAVRDEQAKVLRAIQPLSPEHVLDRAVRGQYGPGTAGGTRLPAYRAETNVAPDSRVETFTALRLVIENWRWNGVPFYLRVGKALPRRATEIVVRFRRPPMTLFRGTSVDDLAANVLVIRVQPEEGISLRIGAKVPGTTLRLGPVDMNFRYQDTFESLPATGYERLLYDALLGDPTLFQRADMVEAAWMAVQPILDVWQALPARGFPNYAAGTWGPPEAEALLARDGRAWHEPGT